MRSTLTLQSHPPKTPRREEGQGCRHQSLAQVSPRLALLTTTLTPISPGLPKHHIFLPSLTRPCVLHTVYHVIRLFYATFHAHALEITSPFCMG